MKYDMTPIKYLEPTFLPLARNRKSYVCPVCGSGTGKKGSGMTSKDNEYWTCWSCGLNCNKTELFRLRNSLSSEEACIGILIYYGISPTAIGESQKRYPVWLSQDELKALSLYRGGKQFEQQEGGQTFINLFGLYEEDPEMYYKMVISRAIEMIGKYEKIIRACGERNSSHAYLVYEYMGPAFDDSSYQKVKQEATQRLETCVRIKSMYTARLKDVS